MFDVKMHREERMSGGRQSMEERAVVSQSSFYPGFTDFKLCNFINVSPWLKTIQCLPTLFIVKAEIFSMTHKPLGIPPSAFPSDPVSCHSDLHSFHTSHAGSVLFQPRPHTSAPGPLHWPLLLPALFSLQTHYDLLLYSVR